MQSHQIENGSGNTGLFTLSLRWVIGWTYFSAFWRRLILENKLIPETAGYIGEKFNHFLPNALGIKPIIEYLVSNPDALHTSMVVFTIVEAIVGLFMILGLFTRLMSIGVFFLALGILLGSGWLGTTCLDEWQIGVLGLSGGFTIFLTGSGAFSLDGYLLERRSDLAASRWFVFTGSGFLYFKNYRLVVAGISALIIALTLFTNQYFHGGVWGKLHNKSVKPEVEISHISYNESQLQFQVFRTEGADVYGSFLIGIEIRDKNNLPLKTIGQSELSRFPMEKIRNYYVARVRPGKHSLILPLGAKARITLDLEDIKMMPGYIIRLVDISGLEWTAIVK